MSRFTLIMLIDIYRNVLSPFTLHSCRHWPTCSGYAREAIGRYGIIRGTSHVIKRLLRCHPFSKPTMDPIR